MTTNLIKLPLSTQNTKAKVYSTILPGFLILYYSAGGPLPGQQKDWNCSNPTTLPAGKFMQAKSVQEALMKKTEQRRTWSVSSRQAEPLAMWSEIQTADSLQN